MRGFNPGLSTFVRAVLGLQMDKGKELQAFPWEQRPLPPEQLRYAAADAAVMLDCHAHLARCGVRMPPTTRAAKAKRGSQLHSPANSRPDFDPSTPVDFLWVPLWSITGRPNIPASRLPLRPP